MKLSLLKKLKWLNSIVNKLKELELRKRRKNYLLLLMLLNKKNLNIKEHLDIVVKLKTISTEMLGLPTCQATSKIHSHIDQFHKTVCEHPTLN
jgi:hypothetical protein